jgi:hypothetical protein
MLLDRRCRESAQLREVLTVIGTKPRESIVRLDANEPPSLPQEACKCALRSPVKGWEARRGKRQPQLCFAEDGPW